MDLSTYQVTGINNPGKQVSVTKWNNFLASLEANAQNVVLTAMSNCPARGSTADAAPALVAAMAIVSANGGGRVEIPYGTWWIGSSVAVPSNVWLMGHGREATILKMANGLNAPGFLSSNVQNVTFSDLTLDGNKANMTSNLEGTGIKFISGGGLVFRHINVRDTEGHGIHINNASAPASYKPPIFDHVEIDGAGSNASNTYGSCFALTTVDRARFTSCRAEGSAKAGFRISGTGIKLENCVGRKNANGGIVPVASQCFNLEVIGGDFSDNGPNGDNDGIRLVGVSRARIIGPNCSNNAGAGINMTNGTSNVTIANVTALNNGQNANAPAADESRDGICVQNSGVPCSNITIKDSEAKDDQGSPTQKYGIALRNGTDSALIDGVDFSGNATGQLGQLSTSSTNVLVGNQNRGLSLPYADNSNRSLTGTTATTDLASRTIAGGEMGRNGRIRGRATFTTSGTVGTKTVSLAITGTASVAEIALVLPAAATDDIVIDFRVTALNSTTLRVNYQAMSGGGLVQSGYFVASPDTSSNWVVKCTGKLGNSADNITQTMFNLDRDR